MCSLYAEYWSIWCPQTSTCGRGKSRKSIVPEDIGKYSEHEVMSVCSRKIISVREGEGWKRIEWWKLQRDCVFAGSAEYVIRDRNLRHYNIFCAYAGCGVRAL